MINPWITNSFIDSCAFDPKYAPEDATANEIFRLHDEMDLPLLIAHSTLKEVSHPNTPGWVKRQAQSLIYTIQVSLTPDEVSRWHLIRSILAGNGKVENIAEDAVHIFEASKYGSNFITTDEHLLKRTSALRREVGVEVLKPSEFLALARDFRDTEP